MSGGEWEAALGWPLDRQETPRPDLAEALHELLAERRRIRERDEQADATRQPGELRRGA